jgi:hypothetical protein
MEPAIEEGLGIGYDGRGQWGILFEREKQLRDNSEGRSNCGTCGVIPAEGRKRIVMRSDIGNATALFEQA